MDRPFRTLPMRTEPIDGESLDSWLERFAAAARSRSPPNIVGHYLRKSTDSTRIERSENNVWGPRRFPVAGICRV